MTISILEKRLKESISVIDRLDFISYGFKCDRIHGIKFCMLV